MTLSEEVTGGKAPSARAGQTVRRLHTGDLSARHREQMDVLRPPGLDYEARLWYLVLWRGGWRPCAEYTLPNVSQTVIQTCMEGGRMPVPESERIEPWRWRDHGAFPIGG